jgi:hypothetical protein
VALRRCAPARRNHRFEVGYQSSVVISSTPRAKVPWCSPLTEPTSSCNGSWLSANPTLWKMYFSFKLRKARESDAAQRSQGPLLAPNTSSFNIGRSLCGDKPTTAPCPPRTKAGRVVMVSSDPKRQPESSQSHSDGNGDKKRGVPIVIAASVGAVIGIFAGPSTFVCAGNTVSVAIREFSAIRFTARGRLLEPRDGQVEVRNLEGKRRQTPTSVGHGSRPEGTGLLSWKLTSVSLYGSDVPSNSVVSC